MMQLVGNLILSSRVMAGVRTPQRQFSSCVLVETDDDLDSINATSSAIVKYSRKQVLVLALVLFVPLVQRLEMVMQHIQVLFLFINYSNVLSSNHKVVSLAERQHYTDQFGI